MDLQTVDGKSISEARSILVENGYPAQNWASFVVIEFYNKTFFPVRK